MGSSPVSITILLLVALSSPALASDQAPPSAAPAAPHQEVAATDAPPPPRVLDLLARTHRPRQWLYVTTTSERLRLRADDIGPDGLEGLHAFRAPAPPSPLGWDRIVSIERRQSRRFAGALLGAVAGSVVLGYAGGALAESSEYNKDAGAWTGIAAGAVLGGWAGARIGDRRERTSPLYVAPGYESRAGALALTRTRPWVTVDAQRARRSVRARTVLRVRGTFGQITGQVASIDADGIHGMEPDSRFDTGSEATPDPILWSSVWSVHRRGTAARRGATVGAVLLGVGSGALGAAVAASGVGLSYGGDSGEVAGAFFGVGAIGALVGAGIGALIGHMIPVWHSVPGVSLDGRARSRDPQTP